MKADSLLGMGMVGRVADLGQGLARPGLDSSRQTAQDVGELVDPVALVAGRGDDVPQRRP
jgi:hypothetical protein